MAIGNGQWKEMTLYHHSAMSVVLVALLSFLVVGQEKEPARTIRVQGTGKVKVVPDQLHLAIQINIPRAETAAEALSRNNQLTSQLIAMIKRFGIAEGDLQTTRVSVNPVYDYDKRISPPPIVGYSAQNEVTVVVRKIEDAGKIMDQAVKNGATGFGQLQYESSKRTELEREALKKAADDARAKAEVLAKQLGASIGRAMSIVESGISPPAPVIPLTMQERTASADVPLMPGEMEIQASVEVVFEMK